MAQTVIKIMLEQARQKSIRIRLNFVDDSEDSGDKLCVKSDQSRIVQVLVNMIQYALSEAPPDTTIKLSFSYILSESDFQSGSQP